MLVRAQAWMKRAIAMSVAAIIMLVGGVTYAPTLAAYAAAPPAGIVNRPDIMVDNIVLKKYNGKDGPTTGGVDVRGQIWVTWDWHVPASAPRPKPNESFVLEMPNELGVIEPNNFALKYNGEDIGTCYPVVRRITCVFND